MDELMSPPPSPKEAGGSSLTTPKTCKRRLAQQETPGSPDPGNGTLFGFPGIEDFLRDCMLPNTKLSLPKKTAKNEACFRTESGQQALAFK